MVGANGSNFFECYFAQFSCVATVAICMFAFDPGKQLPKSERLNSFESRCLEQTLIFHFPIYYVHQFMCFWLIPSANIGPVQFTCYAPICGQRQPIGVEEIDLMPRRNPLAKIGAFAQKPQIHYNIKLGQVYTQLLHQI